MLSTPLKSILFVFGSRLITFFLCWSSVVFGMAPVIDTAINFSFLACEAESFTLAFTVLVAENSG